MEPRRLKVLSAWHVLPATFCGAYSGFHFSLQMEEKNEKGKGAVGKRGTEDKVSTRSVMTKLTKFTLRI